LADFWADCVPGEDDRPSLLEKFSGKCSLQGWLATVTTRRWIDLKRKQARRGTVGQAGNEPNEEDPLERMPAAASHEREDFLVNLLRESLQAAFARCPAEAMVLLRLIYLHGLSQRELARILGRHESKVSRILSQAMEQIERDTLQELKARDPLLELTWQDFLDMCETQQVGFL
jgi:RNA polymerase sigma factor (sigma-70 family)